MFSTVKSIGKRILRRQLQKKGFDICRPTASNGPEVHLFPLLIEHLVARGESGAILEIGANDGVMLDPVRHLIVSFNLPALLVEPLPDVFDALRRNYSGFPRVRFENVAIGAQSGEAEIFRIKSGAEAPDWMHGLAGFKKSLLVDHINWSGTPLQNQIESLRVPVLTIRQLLEKHPALPPIMALQIDTEGHDYEVVKSAVEGGCLPRIINYEHKHLSFDDQRSCRELLTAHGYAFASNQTDTLAYKT